MVTAVSAGDAPIPLLTVLGPVELHAGAATVDLGSAKQRRTLAVLALNAGHPVSPETLIDRVWSPDHPPGKARHSLYTYITRLRRALEAAAGAGHRLMTITRRPAGYLFEAPVDSVDLLRFRQLTSGAAEFTRAGRHGEARQLLHEALMLWHGEPLAGVTGEWIGDARRLLYRERLAALTARVDADLRLGRHAEILLELGELVAAHPLDEYLIERYLLALNRCGRRAQAVAYYGRARRRIIDELGVEPGQRLRQLFEEVLRDGPGADSGGPASGSGRAGDGAGVTGGSNGASSGAGDGRGGGEAPAGVVLPPTIRPAQLPAVAADFVGRDDELARIRAVLAPGGPTWAGAPKVVCLTGMPGVGKSALALQLAWSIRAEYPDGSLYVALGAGRSSPAAPHAVLGVLIRAFGVSGEAVPMGQDERAGLYRSIVADRRVLLVLDDAASEDQVRPLLPAGSRCAVLVTSRRPLAGLSAVARFTVDLFRPKESMRLLTAIAGPHRVWADPQAAAEVVRGCGGLPLAVRVAGARLAVRPDLSLRQLATRLTDESQRLDALVAGDQQVRATIRVAYRQLSVGAQALLRRFAGLLLPTLTGTLAVALLGTDPGTAEGRLGELVESQLLQPIGDDAGGESRYSMHDLVRLYAAEQAATRPAGDDRAPRRLFETLLDTALRADASLPGRFYPAPEPAGGARLPDEPTGPVERPAEWFEANLPTVLAVARVAVREGWADGWRLAVAPVNFLAMRGYADEWAALNRLAAQAPGSGEAAKAALLLSEGGLLRLRNEDEHALRCYRRARLGYLKLGDERLAAVAATGLAMTARGTGYLRLAGHAFDWALHRLTGTGGFAEAYACLGLANLAMQRGGQPHRIVDLLVRAADLFEAAADHRGHANAIACLGILHSRTGDIELALAHLHDAADAFARVGDLLNHAFTEQRVAAVHLNAGEVTLALPYLQRALYRFRSLHHAYGEARTLSDLARAEALRSRPAAQVALLERAVTLLRRTDTVVATGDTLFQLARAYLDVGAREAAADAARQARELMLRCGSAEAEAVAAWLAELGSRPFAEPTGPRHR